MNLLKDRIERIRTEMGWSAAETARQAGLSRSAVTLWLNGSVNTIGDVEVSIRLERATGYSALWIAKGVGPERLEARIAQDFWPFPLIDEQKIFAMSSEDRNLLEAGFIMAARLLGQDIKRGASAVSGKSNVLTQAFDMPASG